MIRRIAAGAAAASALLFAVPALSAAPAAASAANPWAGVDSTMINRIADEGFNRGQVMETIEYLSDQIGGRMTNSPSMRKAEAWTAGKFTEWGLKNVQKVPFDFGRGWWIERSSGRVIAPRPIDIREIPVAWTAPTKGVVSGEVVIAPMTSACRLRQVEGQAQPARWC